MCVGVCVREIILQRGTILCLEGLVLAQVIRVSEVVFDFLSVLRQEFTFPTCYTLLYKNV